MLSSASTVVPPGGIVQLTVTLDLPAPTGGTPVAITVNPPGAGTVPPTVTVLTNQQTATFAFTDTVGSGMTTVTATLGTSTSSATITVTGAPNHLVISQVYGGGGNSGAPFRNDFVELHNPTPAPLTLAAGSVQYAGSTGSSWTSAALPVNLTVPAGGYLLIQLAGGTNGVPLPTPDVTPTTVITMAQANGKVALVAGTTALSGMCPTGSNVIDFVGYGSANCSEGMSPTAPISNTTSAQRKQNGCVDNDNNGNDFAVAAPAPRNSATAPAICP
jgi:hypothetical protein